MRRFFRVLLALMVLTMVAVGAGTALADGVTPIVPPTGNGSQDGQ